MQAAIKCNLKVLLKACQWVKLALIRCIALLINQCMA